MGHVKYRKNLLERVGKRTYLVIALIIITAVATLVFATSQNQGWANALYAALCSISWAHCDPNYAWPAKIISLVLALCTWTVLAVLMEAGVESFMNLEFGGRRMKKKIGEMKNHIIVCGYGALGKTVAEALENEGADYVIIDMDQRVLNKLKEMDIATVDGNALETKVLKEAGAERARLVVSALGTDADNVFLTLTAKEINPEATVATRAFTESAVAKLHRAGAEIIVMPEIIGGLELAKEALNLEESHLQKLVSRKLGTFHSKKLPSNPKYNESQQAPK